MELASIASGSSGNCIYIGNESSHFLVDTGISRKRIVEGLAQMEITPDMIDGIFITHEHIDHINGLGVFLRKYPVPVFATSKTIDAILSTKSLGNMNPELFTSISPDHPIRIGNITANLRAIFKTFAPLCRRVSRTRRFWFIIRAIRQWQSTSRTIFYRA